MRKAPSLRRAAAIARKEVFHIFRDPFTLAMALGLPVLMVTIFGLAIEFNMRNLTFSVFDADHTQASRQLTEAFGSSGYFRIRRLSSPAAALRDLDRDEAKGALIIPENFERELLSERGAQAQLLVDGADNSTVGVILGYISGVQRKATEHILGLRTPDPLPADPIQVKTRFLFNPELNSRWFVVPGLIVVVISVLSVLLTAMTVAREWENGSMELLLSTPVRPMEIILGKLAPYTVLGLAGIVFVYLAARLVFGVPFLGSHLLFLCGCLLFLGACLAQGLVISVVTRKQQLAMQFALLSGLLPSLLLSGFIFPVESMPAFFQYFTSILPAKWFMMISRGIFLRGAGIMELAQPFFGLTILAFVLITAATKRFKRDLEP